MHIPRGLKYPLFILCLPVLTVHQAAVGVQEAPLPQISALHPRIYVRNDAAIIGSGLTVSQLRGRVSDPAYARWRRQVPGEGLTSIVERAARYLETRSADDLAAVRNFLLTHTFSQREHDVGGLLARAEMAMALDWIYDGLLENDRATILSNIVTTADSSRDFLLNGEPDVNHNYTYMALSTVAICGLVLKGERNPFEQSAASYLALAQSWLEGRGKVLDTWRAREGAWAEGSHYTFHETVRTLIMTLHAYRTATNTDYLALIEKRYGNFVAGTGRFLIACTRPDLTFERTGDTLPSRALAAITVPLTLEMLASGLSDGSEQARLRSFAGELVEAYGAKALHPAFDWGMRMFFDARAPVTPSYRTLPLAMRLGSGTDEHVVFRNGWSQDSTQITILAGNHYTDHQHFDKGSFLIYHGGGLTLDSGVYDDMYKPQQHWNNYATRTLAHNCMLIFDPGESLPRGYANDGGQALLRGLQHHGDWMTYLEHSKTERLGASRVLAFEEDETAGFDYLRCDLAGAYGNKVESYERHFVYLKESDSLVVFDRVRAARPEFRKSWLLHFQERPMVDDVAPEPGIGRFPQAKVTSMTLHGRLVLEGRTVVYDGALQVHTLLPERRTITVIGGPGYEYFNSLNGTNYPPAIPDRANAPREAGAWRMELAPSEAAQDDLFLNALQIAGGAVVADAETRLLKDADQKCVGVQIRTRSGDRIVLFSRNHDGTSVSLPLRYEIETTGLARHLLLDMPSGRSVTIAVGGKTAVTRTVGPRGILSFEDRSTGKHTIEIRH